MRIGITAFAVLLSSTPSFAGGCDTFYLGAVDTEPYIVVEKAHVSIGENGTKTKYETIIEKRFGALVEGAIESRSADTPIHLFTILDDKNGKPRRLIFDGVVFTERCELSD